MKFYQQLRYYPFIRLLIPFIAGIILSLFVKISVILLIILFLSLLIFLIGFAGYYKRYRLRWVYGILIHAVILISGLLYVRIELKQAEAILPVNNAIVYKAIVMETPEVKEKSIRTILKIAESGGSISYLKNQKILASFRKSIKTDSINSGDVLMIQSKLLGFDGPRNPLELNYKRIMCFKGIHLKTYINEDSYVWIGSNINLKVWSVRIREKILKSYYESGIKGNELAVLSALTLGYTDEIPDEITRAYTSAGVIHILSVSGLHVGIIYLVLNTVLFFLKKIKHGQIVKLILVILVLWLFALIAGLRPSVVRAALMFSLIQLGISLKKPADIFNIIAFSAFIILLINPLQITDIGFQLSYLAITGIVIFQPEIYSLYISKNYLVDKIWVLLSVSISAQIAASPVTMFYFHQFPVYFWLANLFIIPWVALITYLSVFVAFIASVHLTIPFVGNILNYSVKLMNYLIDLVEKLPFSTLTNINISFIEMMLIYIFVIFLFLFLINKNSLYFKLVLVSIFVFLIADTLKSLPLFTKNKFIVFHSANRSAFALLSDKYAVLLHSYDDNKDCNYNSLNYLIKNGIADKTIYFNPENDSIISLKNGKIIIDRVGDNILFSTNNFRGIWINKPLMKSESTVKLNLDCIILSDNVGVNYDKLSKLFNFNSIILDASNADFYIKRWSVNQLPNNIKVYNVKESGSIEFDI